MERGSSACFLLAFQCEVFLCFISLEKRVQVEHEFYQFRVNVVFVIWAKLFESQVGSFAGAAVVFEPTEFAVLPEQSHSAAGPRLCVWQCEPQSLIK
jgi:hypothetical protein